MIVVIKMMIIIERYQPIVVVTIMTLVFSVFAIQILVIMRNVFVVPRVYFTY